MHFDMPVRFGRTKGINEMKLLVAIDLSQGSQSVIDAVNQRPWQANSEACVLHIVDMTLFPINAELLEAERQGAESAVNELAGRLGKSGPKVRTEVLVDYPRSAVPEYAKKWGAEFIFVGSHGLSSLARFLLGSVARNVVRAAPCSVEIVRASTQDPSRARNGLKILLATDGSDCSTRAVLSVAKRLWPSGTCLKVISAVSPFFPIAGALPGYFEAQQAILPSDEIERTSRFRAAEAIAKAEKLLQEASIARLERSAPLTGDPKAVILDQAAQWGADLIVVVSHGWRGFDRLMIGSVSESLALHAPCSVEVIRWLVGCSGRRSRLFFLHVRRPTAAQFRARRRSDLTTFRRLTIFHPREPLSLFMCSPLLVLNTARYQSLTA